MQRLDLRPLPPPGGKKGFRTQVAKDATRAYKLSKATAARLIKEGTAAMPAKEDPSNEERSESPRLRQSGQPADKRSPNVPKLTPYQRLAKELWGRPVDGANLPTKGDAALLRLRKKCPDIRTAISSSAYARPENELISAREAVYYLASVHSEAMNQQDAAAAKQDTRESRQLKLRSFHLLNSFDYKKGKVPRLNLLDVHRGEVGGQERALTEPYRQMASSLQEVLSSRYPAPAPAPASFRVLRGRNVAEPLQPLQPLAPLPVPSPVPAATASVPAAAAAATRPPNALGAEGGGRGAESGRFAGAEESVVVVVQGVQDSPERSIEDSIRYLLRGYPVQLVAVYERADTSADVTIRFPARPPALAAAEVAWELGLECRVCSEADALALHSAFHAEQGPHVSRTTTSPFPLGAEELGAEDRKSVV